MSKMSELNDKIQEKQYFIIRGILRWISKNRFRSVWGCVLTAILGGYLFYYHRYVWQLILCAVATAGAAVLFILFKILCAYHDKHYIYYKDESGEICVKYVKDSFSPEKKKTKRKTFTPVVVATSTKTNYFIDCKSLTEAKALHRTLAKQYHPDQTGDNGEKLSEINKQFGEFEKKISEEKK